MKLTVAQALLMREAAKHEIGVTQIRRRHKSCRELVRLRLADYYGYTYVQLTDAGRAWLAANPGRSGR